MTELPWRKTDLWETDSFNEFGDIGIGRAWSAEYTRNDGERMCVVTYGVTPATFDDPLDNGVPEAYGIEEKVEVWTPDWDDENQYDRGRDHADIDYDCGWVYSIDTLEDAEKKAYELASVNLSYALI